MYRVSGLVYGITSIPRGKKLANIVRMGEKKLKREREGKRNRGDQQKMTIVPSALSNTHAVFHISFQFFFLILHKFYVFDRAHTHSQTCQLGNYSDLDGHICHGCKITRRIDQLLMRSPTKKKVVCN